MRYEGIRNPWCKSKEHISVTLLLSLRALQFYPDPKMSGREVAERVIAVHPEIKILYMSGYTDNAIVHHGILDQGLNYIQKPFSMENLARKVREVLDK